MPPKKATPPPDNPLAQKEDREEAFTRILAENGYQKNPDQAAKLVEHATALNDTLAPADYLNWLSLTVLDRRAMAGATGKKPDDIERLRNMILYCCRLKFGRHDADKEVLPWGDKPR